MSDEQQPLAATQHGRDMWTLFLVDENGEKNYHVVPRMGREHSTVRTCWCEPREAEPHIFVHSVREVA